MTDPIPSEGEWICRRCGSVQEPQVSICTACGAPSTPVSEGPSVGTGDASRNPFDLTTILFVILVATVIVLLALAVPV